MADARASKIMIIRHAEKPDGVNNGVTETGVESKHDLTVRGWQRAGALACYFAPQRQPPQSPLIVPPQFLFASAPPEHGMENRDTESKSMRPMNTLVPLGRRLNLHINTSFSKGQERDLAKAACDCPGNVLIAWQHEAINDIIDAIPGRHDGLPSKWPSERFDVVYVLDLDSVTKEYRFSQVPQRLLDGDGDQPIRN